MNATAARVAKEQLKRRAGFRSNHKKMGKKRIKCSE
jgi:hypothetical protein